MDFCDEIMPLQRFREKNLMRLVLKQSELMDTPWKRFVETLDEVKSSEEWKTKMYHL